MILEENIGGVVCTIIRENGQTAELSVGDYFSDHERSTLTVVGTGKIVVRVDPNCTVEIRGVEAEAEAAPVEAAPVEAAPAPAPVEVVVEDKVAATEAPVIVNPKAKA
jgi:hypothetical protein